jgi:hypothetical protein
MLPILLGYDVPPGMPTAMGTYCRMRSAHLAVIFKVDGCHDALPGWPLSFPIFYTDSVTESWRLHDLLREVDAQNTFTCSVVLASAGELPVKVNPPSRTWRCLV